jgi:hypothetical protein
MTFLFWFYRRLSALRCKAIKSLYGLQAEVGEKHAFRNPDSRLRLKKLLTLSASIAISRRPSAVPKNPSLMKKQIRDPNRCNHAC